MIRILALVIFYSIVSIQNTDAQERTISGTVTSMEDGSPLPGVNIIEKGTTNATITNVDGYYEMPVSDGSVLIFSFIGLRTEQREVGSRSVIDVNMSVDAVGGYQEPAVYYSNPYPGLSFREHSGSLLSRSSFTRKKYILTGTIIDASTKEKLRNITLEDNSSLRTIKTNRKGKFKLKSYDDRVSLEPEGPGYANADVIYFQFKKRKEDLGIVELKSEPVYYIHGLVQDAHDNKPVKDVEVSLWNRYTRTDRDGKFSFFTDRYSYGQASFERYPYSSKQVEMLAKDTLTDVGVISLYSARKPDRYATPGIPISYYDDDTRMEIGYYGGSMSPFGVSYHVQAGHPNVLKADTELRYKTDSKKNNDFNFSLRLDGIRKVKNILHSMEVSYRNLNMMINERTFQNRASSVLYYLSLPVRNSTGRTEKETGDAASWRPEYYSVYLRLAGGLSYRTLSEYDNLTRQAGIATSLIATFRGMNTSVSYSPTLFINGIQHRLAILTGFKYYGSRFNAGVEIEKIRQYEEVKITFRYLITRTPSMIW